MDWSEVVRKAAALAEKQVHITFDQLNKLLPPEVRPEQIESLMNELKALGIRLVEDDPASTASHPSCSFCGKIQSEVLQLIAGPHSFICNECVQLCVGIVAAQNPGWLEEHRQFLTTLPLKPNQ